jgi:hypothetical protein
MSSTQVRYIIFSLFEYEVIISWIGSDLLLLKISFFGGTNQFFSQLVIVMIVNLNYWDAIANSIGMVIPILFFVFLISKRFYNNS